MRFIIRLGLALVFSISVVVVIVALRSQSAANLDSWAAVAAALAVVAAVLSSWSAQRVLELQEDESKPNPYPVIDSSSRYGLFQLRVTNLGGGVAHDIRLDWDQPLRNSKGEEVRFSGSTSEGDIAVLLPKESISTLIDGAVQFFGRYPAEEANYSGFISCSDASGRRYKQPFRVSVGQLSKTLVHADEAPKTHVELQKIPDRLESVASELRRLREQLEADNDPI